MATTTTTSGPTNRNGNVLIGQGQNSNLGNVSLGQSTTQQFGLANPAATGNRTFQYFTSANGLIAASDLQVSVDFNAGEVNHRSSHINRFTSYRDEPKDATNLGNANIILSTEGMYYYHPTSDSAGTLYQNYPASITPVTPATDYEARVGYGFTGSFIVTSNGPAPTVNSY